MQVLTEKQVKEVSGAFDFNNCTWSGFFGSAIGTGIAGAVAGSVAGGIGAGPGFAWGAVSGMGAYVGSCAFVK